MIQIPHTPITFICLRTTYYTNTCIYISIIMICIYIYIHKACIYIYTWIRLGTAQDSCEMFVLQPCPLSYVRFSRILFPELCDNSRLRWGPPYNSFILGSSLHMCKILMRSSLCVVFSLARTFLASLGRTAAAAMHCSCHP